MASNETRRGLTARGVRTILTRAGIDYSQLTITEKVIRTRHVDFDETGPWKLRNEVRIEGSKDARRPASDVLFERGLSCAPYGDHDEWFRR